MLFDTLFGRSDWRRFRSAPTEPRLAGWPKPGRSAAARDGSEALPALPAPAIHLDVREMSPRQLADWAHEMYLCGWLNWPEYRLAGFPAELHPQYNRTIGALTGQYAQPDRPRDMVREWEDRLAFARRHNDPADEQVRRTEKVLNLLRRDTEVTGRGRAGH